MTLTKQSQRARSACKVCGSTGLYKAYCDDDYRYILMHKTWATEYLSQGDKCNDYNVVHICDRRRLPSHFQRNGDNEYVLREDSQNEEGTPQEHVVVETTTAPPPPADAMGAFDAFLSSRIDAIARDSAREVVKETVFPTVTVVLRENQEPITVQGSHQQLGDVLIAAMSRHVLMVGPAGTGKSYLAQTVAEQLGLRYASLSLTSQTPASALTGMVRAEDVTRPLFREIWEHGGLFNLDEMDHAHPNILGVINEALSNGVMAFPDGMVPKHETTRITATANTYGRGADRQYVGANQLDAATLDRFFTIDIGYDESLETAIAYATGADNATVEKSLELVRRVRRNLESNALRFIASPRATSGICSCVRDGMCWDTAVDGNLRKGASDDIWAKLTAA